MCALAQPALHPDFPPVSLHEPLDDGKLQPGAIPGAPGRIPLIKPVKDFGQLFLRNANSIIFNGKDNGRGAFAAGKDYLSVLTGK